MAGEVEELARLERRIADVQHAIEQASHRCGWLRGMRERGRVLALLGATLKALQARRATPESGNK
jgi:hypothetical protein